MIPMDSHSKDEAIDRAHNRLTEKVGHCAFALGVENC